MKMCRGDYECEGSEHEVVDKESGWVKSVAKKRVVGDGGSGGRSDSRRILKGGTSTRMFCFAMKCVIRVTVTGKYIYFLYYFDETR